MSALITTPIQTVGPTNWYLDCGATHHITTYIANFNGARADYAGHEQIHVGNGKGLAMKNLLHVPEITKKIY